MTVWSNQTSNQLASSSSQNITISFMESSLCLSYGHPSTMRLGLPFQALNTSSHSTKHHLNLISPPSLSFHSRQRLPGRRVVYPFIRASDRSPMPSTNDKGDNEIAKGTVGAASLVLACALGIIGWNCRIIPEAIASRRPPRIQATESHMSTISGKGALLSLLDVSTTMASSKSTTGKIIWEPPKARPSMEEVRNIYKGEAVRLMKNGEPNMAVKKLQNLVASYQKQNESEPAYHAEMALVEILICQGKYKEALKCKCLAEKQSQIPHDVRHPLYKAILYTMLENKKKAKKYWKKFIEAIEEGLPHRPE